MTVAHTSRRTVGPADFRRHGSGLAALPVLSATPVVALYRDDGDSPGPGFGALETLAWFVAAPLGLLLLIAVLVAASSSRPPRYRPGSTWWAGPVWFGGSPGTAETDADARRADATVGPATTSGGASARW